MHYDEMIMVCEKCGHRLIRVKSFTKYDGTCCWKTEYGCGLIDLKPIRARWVLPGTDPAKVCPKFYEDPEGIKFE